MTAEDRVDAARIAIQLQRAAREVMRAVQSADAGDPGTLIHLLGAELDVEGVRGRLRRLRRRTAIPTVGVGRPAGGGGRPVKVRDAAGRFTKVHNPGAR